MFNKESFITKNKGSLTDHYTIIKELGQGSYGKVFQVKHKDSNTIRACKQLAVKQIDNMDKFETEIDIMSKMDHPNIIKLYEVFKDKRFIYLVMEECTGGELFDRIIEKLQNGTIFTEREAAKIFKQIISAVSYCHKKGICHRDLKPENLLLANSTDDSPLKIIDFGLSNNFKDDNTGKDKKMTSKVGTAYYVAPEVLEGNYNEKCDVWSAGVILYILLCGDPPFNGPNDDEIYKKILGRKFLFSNKIWKHISNESKELIKEMLSDYNIRPSAEDVYQNCWIQELAPNSKEALLKLDIPSLKQYGSSSKFKKAVITFICSRMKDEEVSNLKEIFQSMDKNGDGHLTLEELGEGMQHAGLDKREIASLFKKMDTDKSGLIDYTEFLSSSIQQKECLKEEKLTEAFKAFDKDGSGKISKEEIYQVLKITDPADKRRIDETIKKFDKNGDCEIDLEEFVTMMCKIK